MRVWCGCVTVAIASMAMADEFSYDDYAEVLSANVNDEGLVNYAELKSNRGKLDGFIASMGALSQSEYDAWDERAKIAFWCNAYNAITLQRIIDHHPIKKGGIIDGLRFPENSIRQIDGVWEKLKTTVLGEPITLDAIEHQVLRAKFNEPRIHMAIVCAALSCPRLRNEPYVAERLDEQLADQSRNFCGNPGNTRIDRAGNRLYLSAIFDWFDEDFTRNYTPKAGFEHLRSTAKAIAHFVSLHVSDAEAEYLRTAKYDVKFLDYDWTLNEQ